MKKNIKWYHIIESLSINLPVVSKTDVLDYIVSQFSHKPWFPQLRLESFLPQAQEFLRQLKNLKQQESLTLRNEYSKQISRLLMELEKDREIVVTHRSASLGRVPIIEVYDYQKSKFKTKRTTGVIKRNRVKNWYVRNRVKSILIVAVVFCLVGAPIVAHMSGVFAGSPPVVVEKFDEVQIYYLLWVSNQDQDFILEDPILEIIYNFDAVPCTENRERGVILGLYDNVLGKKVDYRSGFIWLKNCVDLNGDGIDDFTKERALSYGNESDALYNVCITIKFNVLEIVKAK